MMILSPKNWLQLRFGKTTKKILLSPPQSGITFNGCTRASIGTVTNKMLKSIPNFILTKKSCFHSTPKKWFDRTFYHSFTFTFKREKKQVFLRGSDFQSVLLGCSLLENEQVTNHTIGVLGSKGVHRTVYVLLMLM